MGASVGAYFHVDPNPTHCLPHVIYAGGTLDRLLCLLICFLEYTAEIRETEAECVRGNDCGDQRKKNENEKHEAGQLVIAFWLYHDVRSD